MFIHRDKMDSILYREVRKTNQAIPELEEAGRPKLAKWPEVVNDIWTGLYKAKPQIDESASGPLAKALQEVTETQEWKNLRNHTMLDELGSAIGASSFGKDFLEKLPPEVLDAEQAANELARAESAQEAVDDPANGYPQSLKDRVGNSVTLARGKAKAAAAAAAKATDGDITQAVRIAARGAAASASEQTADAKEFAAAWGTGQGGNGSMPLGEKLKLAAKIKSDPSMKMLAKMIGRMKRLAQATQASKINREPDEIVDVETGNDLKNVIPAELVKLCNPTLKLAFYRDYQNRQLIQYRKEGKAKAAKGELLLMTDESGSMSGTRITWAKAVGLALAWIAQKQKRPLVLGGFSCSGQIWSKEFDKGTISGQDMEAYAKQFYGGGTDFQMALERCVEIVKNSKLMKKADVVFISDGDCYISEAYKQKFKRDKAALGFRVIAVGVGTSADSFKDFADVAFGFNGDLGKDEEALERIFSV